MGEKLTYTVEEVAKLLGLSRSSMYQAIRNNSVPSLRIGGRILISKIELEKLLSQNTRRSRAKQRRGTSARPGK